MKRSKPSNANASSKRARHSANPTDEQRDTHDPTGDIKARLGSEDDNSSGPDIDDDADNESGSNTTAMAPFAQDPVLLVLIAEVQAGVLVGEHYFVTGPAGSGKSEFIKGLIWQLRSANIPVDVIAPTGTAAINIKGRTCHSLFGLSPNLQHRPWAQVMQVGLNKTASQRLTKLRVLIIDEISMVAAEFFEQMAGIMREARNDKRPFGGCVVVAVGDFAQLPPVKGQQYCIQCGELRRETVRGKTYTCIKCDVPVDDEMKWCFQAPTWKKMKFNNILLDKIKRQTDPPYKNIVYQTWLGNALSLADNQLLQTCDRSVAKATKLFAIRELADRENKEHYQMLSTAEVQFTCVDEFILSPGHRSTFISRMGGYEPGTKCLTYLNEHAYLKRLRLRENMRVLLLANINVKAGLVNGAQGEVIGWERIDPHDFPRFGEGKRSAGYELHPQSRNLAVDYIPEMARSQWSSMPTQIRAFSQHCDNIDNALPVVRFDNGVKRVIYPHVSRNELHHEGEVTVFIRTQVPLVAGWAITIHKAQGMTLQAVAVDMDRVFSPGQEYVAISRATSLQGLELRNFHGELHYRTPEVVRDFMKRCFPQLRPQMR